MHTEEELRKWSNPVLQIKDPLQRRWAEIVQTMDTHLNGVCPIHLYFNRRPLESTNPYAISYRVNNFQPLTKEAFDRAINAIVDLSKSANITTNIPEKFANEYYTIKDVELYEFCINSLTRVRENDPNAVIVVMPGVSIIDNENVSVDGVKLLFVDSKDITEISKHSIRFIAGEIIINNNKHKYYYKIEDGQYILEYPKEDGTLESYPIIKLDKKDCYISISSNVVHEGKYKLRLPYLFGSAAWGDKFYGQESDFTIQATRFTYLREVRAKEKCDATGCLPIDGVYLNTETKQPCKSCKGTGYVKDDSPLGTIYVDFDKLTGENKQLPSVISFIEPPQGTLESSKNIVEGYYNTMCDSLGLVKQNNTNQSGLSKEYDWKGTLSMVLNMFNDNMRVLQDIYRNIEYILSPQTDPTTTVFLVGEIGNSTLNDLTLTLKDAKLNQSPPSVIESLVVQILQKQLSSNISDVVIDTAKVYDKLFIYGSDELTAARAQFGSYITNKDVYIHNTIIGVIVKYLSEEGTKTKEEIIKYLDIYYTTLFPATTTLL